MFRAPGLGMPRFLASSRIFSFMPCNKQFINSEMQTCVFGYNAVGALQKKGQGHGAACPCT